MASFVAAPACPLATLPSSTPRVSAYAGQQKSFSFNGSPLFSGLKHVPKIQFSKAAKISSTRSRCFRTTISCSAKPETLQIVQDTIAKQLSIEASTVAPETKFADLGADSLDTVEIMMALEEQFGVSIGEGGAENISTVQDAADLIEKLLAASA
ncbi:acyl carrier protein, chloroplastic [Manihot esculenta]|uniref:Acyl carrier protein n=1 Tax=Manihot esculenta TaxID=3983 RepID=A0A2C9W7C2_MANES|nr:acyl carrier protein, chloroplastic [Manihot esculenta]OAY54193.1 hypothetical protein MANES_03G055600v8 [Manihot esculenta]